MKIDEAIAHLKYMDRVPISHVSEGDRRALKLASEALERLKEHREDHIDITYRALPSETKE